LKDYKLFLVTEVAISEYIQCLHQR